MSLSAAVEEARTYLAFFLPEGRAEELTRAAAEEVGPDADRSALLAAAHRRLTDEVRITDEVAADVLVEEVGLTPHDAAGVLGLPDDQVVAAVEEAHAIAEELGGVQASPEATAPPEVPASPETGAPPEEPAGAPPEVRYVFDAESPGPVTSDTAAPDRSTTPAPPVDERPERSSRWGAATVLVGVAVALAVVLAVAMSAGGSGDGDTAVDADADGGVASRVTITDARVTDAMGQDGPGPAREVFAPEEAVIFWFAYEPLDAEAMVELALVRDGEQLIAPSFPLPQTRTDSHVTLPRVVTEEPGSYRIELRRDGRPLVETGFEVEAQ